MKELRSRQFSTRLMVKLSQFVPLFLPLLLANIAAAVWLLEQPFHDDKFTEHLAVSFKRLPNETFRASLVSSVGGQAVFGGDVFEARKRQRCAAGCLAADDYCHRK